MKMAMVVSIGLKAEEFEVNDLKRDMFEAEGVTVSYSISFLQRGKNITRIKRT